MTLHKCNMTSFLPKMYGGQQNIAQIGGVPQQYQILLIVSVIG